MRFLGPTSSLVLIALVVGLAISQPPGQGGAPRFELGKVFPPGVRNELHLTPAQQKDIDALEKEVKEALARLLTAEQKKIAENARPRRPGGQERPAVTAPVDAPSDAQPGPRFVTHGSLKAIAPEGRKDLFTLTGDAVEGVLGDPRKEHSGRGIRLLSAMDADKKAASAGSVSWTVQGLPPGQRWFRLRIRALAQDQFHVDNDQLYLRVEFSKDNGRNPLDQIKKSIVAQVDRDRKDLVDKGTNPNLGLATWRTYALDFRTPFPEVDTLRVGVAYAGGNGGAASSEFWINEVDISPIAEPADYAPLAKPGTGTAPPALASLVKLGGRWYYDPRGGSKEPPKQFDHTNVDRLLYLSDRLETPFVGNVSAWLRQGYYDRAGKRVDKDRLLEDAVVLSFTDKHLVMKSKNLPNHPTAVFPDATRFLDGNPNIIREQADTWYIPLEPKENPRHIAMSDQRNSNRALPMGPIGVAVNGVVFFNPFDAGTVEAIWRLDRCCGHPSPGTEYHYHKYPVCINTPWADDGTGHSPLIGFAFDGYPIYGPYESAGVLAKDSKTNPLNAFNLHSDEQRGPHYQVTPGKFPHLIGGYWGEVEGLNRKGPPR